MTDKNYVQYSKRFTKWGLFLVSVILLICLAVIAFCELPQYAVQSITTLYSSFVAVLGLMIGAYQGNSSVEKWSRAKYLSEEDEQTETESAG